MAAILGRRKVVATGALVLLLALAGTACSGGDDSDGAAMTTGPAADGAGGGSDEANEDRAVGKAGFAPLDLDVQPVFQDFGPERVIKNARVELEVGRDRLSDSVDEVMDLAQSLGGLVVSTSIEDASTRTGEVVIRVPSSGFEEALTQLDDIGRVQGEVVDTQDVSEEFVDLDARLRNARAQEVVLLRLMEGATTIAGSIRVQNELERLQELIERYKGRLRFLRDQTSFSTIAVELAESGVVPQKAGTLTKAWRDAVDMFLGVVSGLIVALGVIVPVAVLLAIGVIAFRLARPRQPAPPAGA